jgi:hypothetical protein
LKNNQKTITPHNFKNHVRENGNKGGKLRTAIGNNMITLVNDDSKQASPLAHSLKMLRKSFPEAPLFFFLFS